MEISINTGAALAAFGALLILTAIIGGGIEIRELKIPRVGLISRLLAGAAGLSFMAVGLVWSDAQGLWERAIRPRVEAVVSQGPPETRPSAPTPIVTPTPKPIAPMATPTPRPVAPPKDPKLAQSSLTQPPPTTPPTFPHRIAAGRWNFQYRQVSNTCPGSPFTGEPLVLYLDEFSGLDGYITDGERVAVSDADGLPLGTYVLAWPVLRFDVPAPSGNAEATFYGEFLTERTAWSRLEMRSITAFGSCMVGLEMTRPSGFVPLFERTKS